MNYKDWLKAVDQALRANNRGYLSAQIDQGHLTASFNSGVSPVIYARQLYHPMKALPPPRQPAKPLTMPCLADNLLAGLFWALNATGVVFCGVGSLLFASLLLSAMTRRQTEEERLNNLISGLSRSQAQASGEFLGTLIVGVPASAFWFFGLVCVTLAFLLRLVAKMANHPAAP